MEKINLKDVRNDDDTIVVADDIAGAIEPEEIEELIEEIEKAEETEPVEEVKEPAVTPAAAAAAGPARSRVLYAILSCLAPLAGTITGLLAAMTYGIGNMTNASYLTTEELDEMLSWEWIADFTSEHAQAEFISRNAIICVITALIAIASVIGLSIMTGRFSKDEEGGIRLNWFDKLWTEIQLAAMILAAIGAVMCAIPSVEMLRFENKIGPFDFSGLYKPMFPDEYVLGLNNDVAFWLSACGMAACLAIAVACFVSLIKKIKAGEFWSTTVIGKLLKWIWHVVAGIFGGVFGGLRKANRAFAVPSDTDRRATVKIITKYCLIAVALILLPIFILWCVGWVEGAIIGLLVSIIAAVSLIIVKVGKLAEIRAGVIEVKSGNLTHKITVNTDANGPKTDLDKLASDINHISEATNAAVQAEIRNQKLKTDLISNVSHDLKTPLTSMISYLDILEKEGLDSEDAPAHLAIVREKTERLRTLTEELFEAAKASSGNIPCEITNIDLNSLIDQSLAEMGDRLSARDLTVRKSIKTDNTMVKADGRLLYRVLENLLSNISKYALEGSRVYIDVSKPAAMPGAANPAGRLLLEVKNISRDELNISADELMERFTRGDSSRNTEGSGLGLAIAKDLTTLMGGVFEIKIDGDMFKASVLLNEA